MSNSKNEYSALPIPILKRIKVKNFKSFANLDISFEKLNILIGPNASGKSNFIEIFQFIHNISEFGLDNAISLQGGIEFIRNVFLRKRTPIDFEFEIYDDTSLTSPILIPNDSSLKPRIYGITYKFQITPMANKNYIISSDELYLHCNLLDQKNKIKNSGTIVFKRTKNGSVTFKSDLKELEIEKTLFNILLNRITRTPNELLLVSGGMIVFNELLYTFARSISIFDFEPKTPKHSVSLSGKITLEPDGSNLAVVLKKILSDKIAQKTFLCLMEDMLPHVSKLDVEDFIDKSIMVTMREKYSKQFFPASLLSDGTINITAIITALFFDPHWVTILEEPERNIHPSLLAKLVGLFRDASEHKQIFISSHHPEIVRNMDLENLLLIHRDKQGHSIITKPKESEKMNEFLKDDMDLGEMYIQNLLE